MDKFLDRIDRLEKALIRSETDLAKVTKVIIEQAKEIKRKDAEIAGLRDEVAILNNVRALWPEIRQLHEGFMASDPSAWTEWDQSVRERSIALSFDLNRASRQKE